MEWRTADLNPVHPAFSLIFHVVCRLRRPRDRDSVRPHECQIDSGRKTASRCKISIFHKCARRVELHIRKLRCETSKCAVIRGRGFTVGSSVFARRDAPVQTDIVTSVDFEDFLTHAKRPGSVHFAQEWQSLSAVRRFQSCNRERFAFRRRPNRILVRPPCTDGTAFLRSRIMTSWKTSHGPQRWMTTAPSETRTRRNVTLVRWFNEVVSVAAAFGFERPSVLTGAAVANNALSAAGPVQAGSWIVLFGKRLNLSMVRALCRNVQ